MVRVRIRRGASVVHDGRAREAGDEFDVSKEDAEALVAQGVAAIVPPDSPADAGASKVSKKREAAE